jgi:hypothetical protein
MEKLATLASIVALAPQLDSTAADIQQGGVQAAGSSALAARADHVHPHPAAQPSDVGVLAWTGDPAVLNGTTAVMTAGKLYLSAFWIRKTVTIANMAYSITNTPATLTAGQNFAAIFNSSGTQMGVSADQSSIWTGGAGTYDTALVSSFSATPGMYWAAFLANGTTTPNIRGTNGGISLIQLGQAAAVSRAGLSGTGLTAMPASFTPSAIAQTSAILHCVVLH